MKNIISMTSALSLGLLILFSACKKEEDFPAPSGSNGSISTQSTDTTLAITTDTLYPPAGDNKSRTFFNSGKQLVFTADTINKNLDFSDDVIFAYIYNNDSTGAELANTYAYSATTLTNWHLKATIFRKNVPSATFDNAMFKRSVVDAWNSATPYTGTNQGGYIASLAAGQVYAFQTEAGKHGLVKIITIYPGADPYKDKLVFQVKMER
ncbi:MAG: hypothetical protein ACJ75J_08030 [Cytophagaceae bacterium]